MSSRIMVPMEPFRTAATGSSARQQLKAILKKNGQLKRRSWCTTCCEIVSPALFCCILVLGYTLCTRCS